MITITHINGYLPDDVVDNASIESRTNRTRRLLPSGSLERLFGIKTRHRARPDEQVSDLACAAALPIVEEVGREEIDFLIFAAACADLIEPATANIVQYKLGLSCPCIDVKNACNSVLSALQVAEGLLSSGAYSNILIVNGEKLSDAIYYDATDRAELQAYLAAYSLGDAGVAMLVSTSTTDRGIVYQRFFNNGQHWPLCTIMGGGSMHPHDMEQYYFRGQTSAMRHIFQQEVTAFLLESFREAAWPVEQIDYLITHQVSAATFDLICAELGICRSKVISIFEQVGNTAAASVPLALEHGAKQHFVTGDKIAIVGFAAGISASLQLLQW